MERRYSFIRARRKEYIRAARATPDPGGEGRRARGRTAAGSRRTSGLLRRLRVLPRLRLRLAPLARGTRPHLARASRSAPTTRPPLREASAESRRRDARRVLRPFARLDAGPRRRVRRARARDAV
eukprot:31484-Pelagococcus_subviridis.AAC.4